MIYFLICEAAEHPVLGALREYVLVKGQSDPKYSTKVTEYSLTFVTFFSSQQVSEWRRDDRDRSRYPKYD